LQKNPVGSPRSGLFEPNKSLPFVSADASTAISHTNYSVTLLGPAEPTLPFGFAFFVFTRPSQWRTGVPSRLISNKNLLRDNFTERGEESLDFFHRVVMRQADAQEAAVLLNVQSLSEI
jgi:hypothetical protein